LTYFLLAKIKDPVPNSSISAALSEEDLAAIAAAVDTIKSKLPFGVTLSADERQALPKLGTRSAGFVNEALITSEEHPEILPATFNSVEFTKDANLFESMLKVLALVAPLAEMIDHTTMAVGSEACAAARLVYELTKTSAKTTPGLQSVTERLGERFKQTRTGEVQAATPKS
jgi:hypothetical protein